jgi:hypothetical protein
MVYGAVSPLSHSSSSRRLGSIRVGWDAVMGKHPWTWFCEFCFVSFRLELSPFAVPVGNAAGVGVVTLLHGRNEVAAQRNYDERRALFPYIGHD